MSTIREIREADRRAYRANVIALVFYQIIIAGPVRLALDSLIPHVPWLQPFIVPILIVFVLLMWLFGIMAVFRKLP